MSDDPYVWPRESVADKPNQAWCTFDLHRGIQVRPRREDGQDKGVCMPAKLRPAAGLQALDLIWYTQKDASLRNRMLGARAARQKGNPS
jgi:hypothetical protein